MAELDKVEKKYWRDGERQSQMKNKARMMAVEHLQGLTVAQLAEKYRVSRSTVTKKLRYAEQQRLIERSSHMLVKQLVPQALGVFELAMTDIYHEVNPQVVTVATRVLEGSGVLRKGGEPPSNPTGDISTIEEYRAWRVTRVGAEGASHEDSGSGESGRGAVLDAHQEDPGGYVDGELAELPEDRVGGGEDPAGSHPEDQGCG
jgi:hypothetical protein